MALARFPSPVVTPGVPKAPRRSARYGQQQAGCQLGGDDGRMGQHDNRPRCQRSAHQRASRVGDLPTADLGRAKPLQLDDNQKAAWRAWVDGFRLDEDAGSSV